MEVGEAGAGEDRQGPQEKGGRPAQTVVTATGQGQDGRRRAEAKGELRKF